MENIVKEAIKIISLELEEGISFDELYARLQRNNNGVSSIRKEDLLSSLKKFPKISINQSLGGALTLVANEELQSHFSNSDVIKLHFSSEDEFLKIIEKLYRIIVKTKKNGICYQALCDIYNKNIEDESKLKIVMMSHYCKKLQHCKLIDITHKESKRLVTANIFTPVEPFKNKLSRKKSNYVYKVEKSINGTYRLNPVAMNQADGSIIKSRYEAKEENFMDEEMNEEKSYTVGDDFNGSNFEDYQKSQSKYEALYSKSFMFRELTLTQNFHLNLSSAEANTKKGLSLNEVGQKLIRTGEKKMLARFFKKVQSANIMKLETESYRSGKTFAFKYLIRDNRYKKIIKESLESMKEKQKQSNETSHPDNTLALHSKPSTSSSLNNSSSIPRADIRSDPLNEKTNDLLINVEQYTEKTELLNVDSFLKMLRFFPENEKLQKKLFSFVDRKVFEDFLSISPSDSSLPPEKVFGFEKDSSREKNYRMLSEVMIKITIENIEFSEVRRLAETTSKHSKRQVCRSKLNRYIFILNKLYEKKVILSFHLRNLLIGSENTSQIGSVDRKTFKYILQSLQILGIVTLQSRLMNKIEKVNPIWNYRRYLTNSKALNYDVEVVFYSSPNDYSEEFIANSMKEGAQNLYNRKISASQPFYPISMMNPKSRRIKKQNITNANDKKLLSIFEKLNANYELFTKTPGKDSKKKLHNFDFQVCKVMAMEYKVLLLQRFFLKFNDEIDKHNKSFMVDFLKKIKPDWNEYFLNKLFLRPANERKYGIFVSSLDRDNCSVRSYLNKKRFLATTNIKRPIAKVQSASQATSGTYEDALKKIDDLLIEEDDFYSRLGGICSNDTEAWYSRDKNSPHLQEASNLQNCLENSLVDDSQLKYELVFKRDISSKPEPTVDEKRKFQEAFQLLLKYLVKNPMKNFRDLKLKLPKILNITKIFSILLFEGMAEVWTCEDEMYSVVFEDNLYSVLEKNDWGLVFYKINMEFYSYL